jgi:hypothetical protein
VATRNGAVVIGHAGRDLPDASWNCTVYAGDPTWSTKNIVIDAEGTQICSGNGWAPQRVRVTLQTYKGLGIWQNRNQNGTPFRNAQIVDYILSTVCKGWGTQTYRTVVDGYEQNGNYHQAVQSGGQPRLTCNP